MLGGERLPEIGGERKSLAMAKSAANKASGAKRLLRVDDLRRTALALPGVTEGTSYGTTAFRVGQKFLARPNHFDGAGGSSGAVVLSWNC